MDLTVDPERTLDTGSLTTDVAIQPQTVDPERAEIQARLASEIAWALSHFSDDE